MKTEYKYHEDLMCSVSTIEYNFVTRTGVVNMEPGHSTDMRGCLDLFKRIDERVKRIETYAGDEPDTVYVRKYNDWDAVWEA